MRTDDSRNRYIGTTALVLLVVLLHPWGAAAQVGEISYDMRSDSRIGVGYIANLPEVGTGLSFFHLVGGGWGYFVDVKHTLDSREDEEHFESELTPDTAEFMGHRNFNDEDEYTALSGGVMWAFHPEVAVYAGAGYTERRSFAGFRDRREDDDERLGDRGGHYWVRDRAESRRGVNATGGLVFQGGRNLFVRGGVELFPAGASAGVTLTIPR